MHPISCPHTPAHPLHCSQCRVPESKEELLAEGNFGLENDLRALANASRLHLMSILISPRTADQVATILGMSRQAALKHLDHLSRRRFIQRKRILREKTWVGVYIVVPGRLDVLSLRLVSIEALGLDHAEKLGSTDAEPTDDPENHNDRVTPLPSKESLPSPS